MSNPILKLYQAVVFLLLLCATTYAQNITISGFIHDEESLEPLIAASISDGKAGTVTNNFGFYSLATQKGNVELEIAYIGYDSQKFSFNLQRDTTINIYLHQNNLLNEATVTAQKESGIRSTYMGAIEIPLIQIKATPTILGEADILKTVQLLPGVQSGTSGLSGLYVRGGGPDENLLMLDGVPLYNAEHLLGLFSVFMPESVKKVTLYKSSFPARYGGRISSVLDIRTNDGNAEKTHGAIGISPISSKLHLEGPLWKGKTSYSISARMMHTIFLQPILANSSANEKYNYWFYDLSAKITYRLDNNDRLYFNIYNGKDDVWYEGLTDEEKTDTDIGWGNTLTSLRWNHVFGSRIFANTTLAYNRYNMHAHSIGDTKYKEENVVVQTEHNDLKYRSGIYDISISSNFDYSPTSSHLVRFGVGMIYHTFTPETLGFTSRIDKNGEIIKDTTYTQNGDNRLHGLEFSAYMEDDIIINKHLSVNPGLHINVFKAQSKGYISIQPRLSMRYGLDNGIAWKIGYSRMSQNIHLLTSTQETLPTDLWVPVTDNIRPINSDQYSIGTYYDGLRGWEFSLEGYYKSMSNVIEYKDGVTMLGNTKDWQERVAIGKGRAYGMELFIQKTAGKTTGWFSYTLAKSERRFPGSSISSGEWYPYKYDRRHQVNVVLNHKFTSRIDLGATWSFYTGGVLTIPSRETAILAPDGEQVQQVSHLTSRGNYRLPSIHKLNIGINFRKQKKHGERVWTISVYNLYNQKSADIVLTSAEKNRINDIYTQVYKLKMVTLLPIVPSIGYSYSF